MCPVSSKLTLTVLLLTAQSGVGVCRDWIGIGSVYVCDYFFSGNTTEAISVLCHMCSYVCLLTDFVLGMIEQCKKDAVIELYRCVVEIKIKA